MSLRRFWFEFDLRGHRPDPPLGARWNDGGPPAYAWLSAGTGVTGRDEADCLAQLRDLVGTDLPPVLRCQIDVEVDLSALGPLGEVLGIGNPAWRGIWWPPVDRGAPRT